MALQKIIATEGSIDKFSKGYETMGIHLKDNEVVYREWAPGAQYASFFGDFSNNKAHCNID